MMGTRSEARVIEMPSLSAIFTIARLATSKTSGRAAANPVWGRVALTGVLSATSVAALGQPIQPLQRSTIYSLQLYSSEFVGGGPQHVTSLTAPFSAGDSFSSTRPCGGYLTGSAAMDIQPLIGGTCTQQIQLGTCALSIAGGSVGSCTAGGTFLLSDDWYFTVPTPRAFRLHGSIVTSGNSQGVFDGVTVNLVAVDTNAGFSVPGYQLTSGRVLTLGRSAANPINGPFDITGTVGAGTYRVTRDIRLSPVRSGTTLLGSFSGNADIAATIEFGQGAPEFAVQPSSMTACAGGTVTLSVGVSGIGPWTFRWWFNNQPMDALLNPSVTTPDLLLNNVRNTDAGRYACVVTNGCDSASSDEATLTICAPDFNCDGFLDFTDFDGFVTAFEAGEASSDFNSDGFLDFTDFDAFVSVFDAGC